MKRLKAREVVTEYAHEIMHRASLNEHGLSNVQNHFLYAIQVICVRMGWQNLYVEISFFRDEQEGKDQGIK